MVPHLIFLMSLGLLATCELPLYSRVTWCLLNIRWQCKLLITLHKLISLQLLYEGQTDMDYNKHKIILTTEKRPVSQQGLLKSPSSHVALCWSLSISQLPLAAPGTLPAGLVAQCIHSRNSFIFYVSIFYVCSLDFQSPLCSFLCGILVYIMW